MDQNNQSNGYVLKSNARLLLVLTATVMASAPICSHADESGPSYKVKYSNPITVEGARHLYAQIERAANYACGQTSMDIEVMMNAPGPCVHEAISRAIHDAKNPNLAQVYIEKNGKDEAQKFGINRDVMTAEK
jgi:UrcA family protein